MHSAWLAKSYRLTDLKHQKTDFKADTTSEN